MVVLIQEGKPMAYFSKNLNDAKKKYSAYDVEFYALVQSLKKWRHYLLPNNFLVYMDNHTIMPENFRRKKPNNFFF